MAAFHRVRATWEQHRTLSVKTRSRRRKINKRTKEVTVMVNNVQRGLPLIGFSSQEYLSGANRRRKDLATKIADNEIKLSYWQFIFLQSKANGCFYAVDDLPHANWQWPKNTWFQERLSRYLHALEPSLERANDQRAPRRALRVRRKTKGCRSPQ